MGNHCTTRGRMSIPHVEGMSCAADHDGNLVVTTGDASMVVEAYAIPASSTPWHDLESAMSGSRVGGSLSVDGVTVIGRDDGRVLARAYINGDTTMFTELFDHMAFDRGRAPMAPMTRLSARDDG